MAKIKNPLKVPPQNIEAEQSVLGSLLLDKNAIVNVADILQPYDFYKPSHEKIYTAILELFNKQEPIDLLSLTSLLKEKATLQDIGGGSYLTELVSSVPSAAHAAHYATIVKEKKVLRDLISSSIEISEKAFEGDRDTEELLDEIEQKIMAISQRSIQKRFLPLKHSIEEARERIANQQENGERLRGITTGFAKLDAMTLGLQKSDFIVVGARPSMGKTALALDIARHAAILGKASVGFFSLEMAGEQITDRIISAESQIPFWRLRAGRIDKENNTELEMIHAALDRLSQVSLYIDDTPSPNILQMRAMARRLQVEHGLDLLIVDYLQLIMPRTNSDNMVQQITEISRGLKSLARELNIPVVALSQLSREVEKRDDRRPRLADLRESGAIEQDADIVLFIHRKNKGQESASADEQNLTEIIIEKHRNGPTGVVKLMFDPDRVTFRPIDDYHGEAPQY